MKYTYFTIQGDNYIVNQYGVMKTEDNFLFQEIADKEGDYHLGYEIENAIAKSKISLDVVIAKNKGIEGGFIGYLAFCPKVSVYSQSHMGVIEGIRQKLFEFNWDTQTLEDCHKKLHAKEIMLNMREQDLLKKGITPIGSHHQPFPIMKRMFNFLKPKNNE